MYLAEKGKKMIEHICENCKRAEQYRKGYDITIMDDECGGCCSWNDKFEPKDEVKGDKEC